jgi:hypothetical protein
VKGLKVALAGGSMIINSVEEHHNADDKADVEA